MRLMCRTEGLACEFRRTQRTPPPFVRYRTGEPRSYLTKILFPKHVDALRSTTHDTAGSLFYLSPHKEKCISEWNGVCTYCEGPRGILNPPCIVRCLVYFSICGHSVNTRHHSQLVGAASLCAAVQRMSGAKRMRNILSVCFRPVVKSRGSSEKAQLQRTCGKVPHGTNAKKTKHQDLVHA